MDARDVMLVGSTRNADAKRRVGWQAWLSAALLALAGATPARVMAEGCKLSAIELPVTMVGSRAIATVGINGTKVKMMVDSGAFFSFLTSAAAEQLQLPTTRMPQGLEVRGIIGKVETRMTTVKRLQLQTGEIPDVEFIVGGSEPGSGALGILGRNLLAAAGDTEYDIAHGMIRLMLPKGDCGGGRLAYWAGGAPVSDVPLLRDKSDLPEILVTAQINGSDVRALLDTGASNSLASLKAARRAGVNEADMKPAGKVGGMGRAQKNAWIAQISKFEIGNEKITNNRLMVADLDTGQLSNDMMLGIDFFLSHRVYVSNANERVYFTYNGGPVFALNAVTAEPGASDAAAAPSADAAQPVDAAGYARRGAAYAARGDNVRALADLDRACEMEPQVAEHFLRRGLVHEALKQWPQARQDFDAALRLDPAETEARVRRAWLRTGSRERDAALDDLQALDKALAPQAPERRDMARMYSRLGLQDRALAQWNLWIPAHPSDQAIADPLNSRCWARALVGVDLDKAVNDCAGALERQPDNADFLDSRAWLRLRRGELRDALADFDRALKIKGESAWSLYGRGIVRTRLGDAEKGRADIEAARKLRPEIDSETGRYGLSAGPQPAPASASGPVAPGSASSPG
jgi:predicted aspartyl protease/tetratricopeptide (TPR) repeat protein